MRISLFLGILLFFQGILIAQIRRDSLDIYQFTLPPSPIKPCSVEIYQFSIPPSPTKPCTIEIYQFTPPLQPASRCSLEIYQFTLPNPPAKTCSLEVYSFTTPSSPIKPCSLEIYQFTTPTTTRIRVVVKVFPDSASFFSVDYSPWRNYPVVLEWTPGSSHTLIAQQYNFVRNRWFYKFKKWTSSRGAETTSLEWNVAPSDSVTYTAHFELYPIIRLHDNVWFDRDGNYRGFMLER